MSRQTLSGSSYRILRRVVNAASQLAISGWPQFTRWLSFIGLHSPEHIVWCGQLRAIPSKRAPRSSITYLEKSEMDAPSDAPDRSTDQGRRDHALLLFLYNTGARADEAAQARVCDLALADTPRDHSLIQVRGKGNKLRRCPFWPQTVSELAPLIAGRQQDDHVFRTAAANQSRGSGFTQWSSGTSSGYRTKCRC